MPFSIHRFSNASSNLCLFVVEWSAKGSYIALARKDILIILSSKFKERSQILLPFKSWVGDSDSIVKGTCVVYFIVSLYLLFSYVIYFEIVVYSLLFIY